MVVGVTSKLAVRCIVLRRVVRNRLAAEGQSMPKIFEHFQGEPENVESVQR